MAFTNELNAASAAPVAAATGVHAGMADLAHRAAMMTLDGGGAGGHGPGNSNGAAARY